MLPCWQIDLEEAKGQEIANLKSVLQEMQEKFEKAHAAIVKEKEEAKLAIEQAPPKIVEVPVVDNAKVELLTSQNKELEVQYPISSTILLKRKIHTFFFRVIIISMLVSRMNLLRLE